MTTKARCDQCGAPVDDNAIFCMRCGVDVSGQRGEDATVQMTTDRATAAHFQSTMRQTLRDATLGEYEILAELGRGGMATVFLAHDIALDRKVAIKVMAPHLLEGEGMVERFKLEARTAAQLSHPHIIPIYAVKETEATLYFVMKFIEGRALDSIIKKLGPLPIPMVKDILTKVGQALGYAHRRDVVHRDVKAGNIMIDEEGTPIVTDFGIAKVTQAHGLTMTGAAIGTPSYMSPEQCGAGEVTGASDQYSLGILAFEMLTAKLPFTGDTVVGIMYKHCHEPLPPLEDFRPDCPPEVRETVVRMLAKDPAERWPSLEAAVQKLGTQSTLSYDDPVRTQMIAVVKEGEHRELLARISTPRSPILGLSRPGRAVQEAGPGVTGTRSRLWMTVVVALLLGFGAAAALLRPWEGGILPGVGGGPEALEAGAEPGLESGAAGTAGAPAGATERPAEGGVSAEGPGGGAEGDANPAAGGEAGDPGEAGTDLPPPGGTDPPPATGGDAAGAPGRSGNVPGAGAPAAAAVATVRIDGVPDRLVAEDVVMLSAAGLDAGGAALRGRPARWQTSDPEVVGVAANGRLTAVAPGEAVVTASVDGVTRDVRVSVQAAPVATIEVGPRPGSLAVGESATLRAELRSGGGAALTGPAVRWSSSDADVADVEADGVVRASGPGRATITAMADGVSGSVDVIVEAPAVDVRTAITDVVERYARALESRDIDQVRRAYPGITANQERELRQALDFMRDLRAELRVGAIDVSGDVATAEISGTYTYINSSSRREEQAPITFRATFERASNGWRLTETR